MLYQKVRPNSLSEVIGNEVAVKAVENFLKNKEKPHTILFRGPSGCGKTTLARILALELGCEPSNIIEKNAAQDRGIEMARAVESLTQNRPIIGDVRVIIYDEAHMLTREAQNGLLKVFEDTPQWQYHILCSTDPNKIIKTLLNRCLQIEVNPLGREEIIDLLVDAFERAGLESISMVVCREIAKKVDGCPREALMLLEKQNGMAEDDALDAINSYRSAEATVIDLCRLIANQKRWSEITKTFKLLKDVDVETIRYGMLGYLASCLEGSSSVDDARKYALMIHELKESTFYSQRAGLLSQIYFALTESKG